MDNFNKLLLAGVAAVTLTVAAGASAKEDMTIQGVQEPTPYSYQSDYPSESRTAGDQASNYEVRGTVDADRDGYAGDVDVDVQAKASSEVNEDVHPEEIAKAQEALNDNGFRVSVDGIIGPETRGALKSFQTSKDMPVTGNLNPQTMAALEIRNTQDLEQRWEHNKM